MAITYVQGEKAGLLNTSVQNVTVTLDVASTEGSLLIAAVSVKHTGTTFTPPSGWTQLATVTAQAQTLTAFQYVDNPGSLSSFAFTMTDAADGMSAIVAEFSGMGTIIAVDKTANANSASSTAMDSGTTATTTNINELWFGLLAYGSGSNKTISGVTNGFTAPAKLIADATIAGNAHGAHVSGYYKIPGSTGAADVGATLSSASTNIGLMIALIDTDGVVTVGGTGGVQAASQALASALVGGSGGIGSVSAQSLASASVGGSGGIAISAQSLNSMAVGGSGGISTTAQSLASVALGGTGGISTLAQSLASVKLGGTGGILVSAQSLGSVLVGGSGGVSAAAMVTVANLPKVLIGATVRDGKITAIVRSGKVSATVRDGKITPIVR